MQQPVRCLLPAPDALALDTTQSASCRGRWHGRNGVQGPWLPEPQYEAQMQQQRLWQVQLATQQAEADRQRPDLPPLPVKIEAPPPPVPPPQQPSGPLVKQLWQKLHRKPPQQPAPQQWQPLRQQQRHWQSQKQALERDEERQLPPEQPLGAALQMQPQQHPVVNQRDQRRQNVLRIFQEQQQSQHPARGQQQPPQQQPPRAMSRSQSQRQQEQRHQADASAMHSHSNPQEEQQQAQWGGGNMEERQQQQTARLERTPSWARQQTPQKPKWWQTREKYRGFNI